MCMHQSVPQPLFRVSSGAHSLLLCVLGVHLCSGTKCEQRRKHPRAANRSEDVWVQYRTGAKHPLKRLNVSPLFMSICGWAQFNWEGFHPTSRTVAAQQALRGKSRVGDPCVHRPPGCNKMEEE